MNLMIFIPMLFCLQLFYSVVGRLSSRNVNTKDDYFLAGKSVKLFPLMMTFLATQVGGGVILGAAEEAYIFGWPVLLYPLGAALGLVLLGCGIGKKLAEFQVSTVAEIFEVIYGSKFLRKAASILSVISLFMILVAQIIASHKFLAAFGFNNISLFILFWSIVILYTAQGGLKAVISTDMVQAGFFMGVFLMCFIIVLFFEPSASFVEMPKIDHFENVSSKLVGWLLMPLLFMVIEQDMGQRCFAGASPKIVSKASLIAGICTMVICVVPVFFGCLAKSLDIIVPKDTSVLMMVISKMTNPFVTSLVGSAVIAAIISTATSLINAISSNLANDFSLQLFKKNDSMRVVRAMTCLISIAAIFFAFYFNNIVDLLIQSYELSVSCLFIPVMMALFKKQKNFLAAWLSMILGTFGFFIFRIYPVDFPKEILSILLSLMGFILGEVTVRYQKSSMKVQEL